MRNTIVSIGLLSAIAPLVAGTVLAGQGIAGESATPSQVAAAPDPAAPPSVQTSSEPAAVAPQPSPAASPEAPAVPRVTVYPALPPPTPLERRSGIQVTRIAVVAAGGLVDLRFKVLDAAKARKRLLDPANGPMLIPEGSEQPLTPPHNALKNVRLADDLVNYILFPNVRNAVKPGTKVVVALAGLRLDPVTAQ